MATMAKQSGRIEAAALFCALSLFAIGSAAQGPAGKVPPQLPPQASDRATQTVQAQTAPTVSLTTPAGGALYTAPAAVALEAAAAASSSGRSIVQVEFFAGPTSIGVVTTAPYSLNWNNVAAGSYGLTARATDNLGVASISAPVAIIVNAPPTVTLESPGSNALFTAPAAITLTATAADTDGSIAQVEFFQGTGLVATVTSAPYTFGLSGVAFGNYTFSARATDDRGAATTSTLVTVRVNAPPSVSLTSPAGNAAFTAPATIPLGVQASDADGTISRVEFYNGSSLIGALTEPPFSTSWLLVPAGSFSLTARVTDNLGATAVSDAVNVTVTQALAQIYYLHTDHLNTPRAIYNQQQQLVWRWDNTDPFGGNVPEENPSGLGTFTCNLRLPGQYFDRETNLHYNYFRDYDSGIGRYVQSDPIGLFGGINSYVYSEASPLQWIDYYGLCKIEVRFSPIPGIGSTLDIFHSYIVTTEPGGGTPNFFRGGPGGPRTLSSWPTWGTVKTTKGLYTPGTPDWDSGSPPSIVILDNDEPCGCYNQKFTETLTAISNARITYIPARQNSNSVVGTTLRQAGFELPTLPVLAPAFGNNLSRYFSRGAR